MGYRSVEFYIALIAAALFVYETNKEKTFRSRFLITLTSAGLGFSVAPELSHWVGGSLVITGILVTALGFLALEVASAIVSDRNFIKELVKNRFGGKGPTQ